MLDSTLGEQTAASFAVPDVAPDIAVRPYTGRSQWSKPAVPDIAKAPDRVAADNPAAHTNPLQEADQHNGDTDFSGPLARLRDAAWKLRYPALSKEVGHGIGARGSRIDAAAG